MTARRPANIFENNFAVRVCVYFERVALADAHRAANLLGDNDPAEIVDSSDYSCCFHYINSLAFVAYLYCLPLEGDYADK